jgi:glycine/D-amino acid oxidase-like deaminating enzyme
MLASAPAPEVNLDRPAYANRGFQYWRQLEDQRVLVGGWRDTAVDAERGYVEEPTPGVQAALEAHLRALSVTVPVERRWAGIMGFTPDGLPLVGEVPGFAGVYICGGYTGHGMGFAFECARLLRDQLVNGSAPPAWLSPGRAWPARDGSAQEAVAEQLQGSREDQVP